MKITVAIVLGFFAGFLAYMAVAVLMSAATQGDSSSVAFGLVAFRVVWITSTLWMRRGAKRVSTVCRRGFLLGAAMWVAMIPFGFLVSAQQSAARSSSGLISNGEAGASVIVG